jgi:hypothetical protein
MGRPLGSKNKSTEVVKDAVVTEITEQKEKGSSHEEERKERTEKALLVKPKLEPLGPGQKYFEAPSGEILIGEEDATHIWWRAGNGGKGMFINPKR